ncbi:MAG: chorismate mutase [Actinomycetota bacterium]
MSTTPAGEMRLRALRGATTASRNEEAEIVAASVELLRTLIERNGLAADDLVSIIFTATPDLDAGFSAAAARAADLSLVPVIGAMEVGVKGGLERCIRVLIHLYTARAAAELRHVYLREARSLPSDLPD